MKSIFTDRVVQVGLVGLLAAVAVSFIELYTVQGLPAHVLIVHGPIVLIPLCVIATAALLVKDSWRERYGPIAMVLTLVAAAMAIMAVGAGEQLIDRGFGEEAIVDHKDAGERLRIVAFLFAVSIVAFIAVDRYRRREVKTSRTAFVVLGALTALFALASLGAVIYTGHTGSKMVWEVQVRELEGNNTSRNEDREREIDDRDNSGKGNADEKSWSRER